MYWFVLKAVIPNNNQSKIENKKSFERKRETWIGCDMKFLLFDHRGDHKYFNS